MAGYDLQIRIGKGLHEPAKAFFRFLRQSAQRHPVTLSFKREKDGEYYVRIDGTPGAKIDAFLQELLLSRGLYYYACGVKNRRAVITKVIVPVTQQLLESRFAITHNRSSRRHIHGRLSEELVPTDMLEPFARKYDGLFRKWDLAMITDFDFVRDLDDLLMEFMLTKLAYPVGGKTPKFDALVGQCGRANVISLKETRKLFSRVHELRTRGLHRREKSLNREELASLAVELFFYFEYLGDFAESQHTKTLVLKGKRYRRIKYGDEELKQPYGGGPIDTARQHDSNELAKVPCHDCHAAKGQFHCEGCDVERCPRCFTQLLSCGCAEGEAFA